jgi:hypothetical protein
MSKSYLFALLSASIFLQTVAATAKSGTGLEINDPKKLYVVYTIEPVHIDKSLLETIINKSLSRASIDLGQRDDAQLFLRVEQHAGQYLLYLDFSRKVQYVVADQCFSKDGFVWGRYAKDITDIAELHEDVQFLIDEFVEDYAEANDL